MKICIADTIFTHVSEIIIVYLRSRMGVVEAVIWSDMFTSNNFVASSIMYL